MTVGGEYASPVMKLERLEYNGTDYSAKNDYYIKRDDLIPFSFGGNKARIAKAHFDIIDAEGYKSVIVCGGAQSNLCRIAANLAAARELPCYVIEEEELSEPSLNGSITQHVLGASIIKTDIVHSERDKKALAATLEKPYIIERGGAGLTGVGACVELYEEIRQYERQRGVFFDLIFLASGSGTTQEGLVAGQLICEDRRDIRGISIAHRNPRGTAIRVKSVQKYLEHVGLECDRSAIEAATHLSDEYLGKGYGAGESAGRLADCMLRRYGIPMDETYTGKGFLGMLGEMKNADISGKKVLFIHTGGTPLFFDRLLREK